MAIETTHMHVVYILFRKAPYWSFPRLEVVLVFDPIFWNNNALSLLGC